MKGATAPPDQPVREAIAAETERNVSVQAGAGTGKTTLMVRRVSGLVKKGIPLDRLAVVTFTDAAAAELRLRIRRRLKEEADGGSSECAGALENISSAWISTIHGFASRILKEYFSLAGVDPAFATTESHFTPVEIAREWDSWLISLCPSPGDMRLLSETGTDVQKMIALGMEQRRWLDSPEMVGGAGTVSDIFIDFMETHGAAVESMMRQCSDHSDNLYLMAEDFMEGLRRLERRIPEPEPDLVVDIYGKINLNSGSAAHWTDRTLARSVLGRARDRFREISGTLCAGRLTELTWNLAGRFAEELRKGWDGDRSRLSYDDLLYTAWRAISRSGKLAGLLADRFDHILIDEFQDTSREQTRLFMSFLEQDGCIPRGRITIVADDKQSIYGWRNADIETYSEFRDRLEASGALSASITTNFRSSRSIIRFVNRFGDRLFRGRVPEEVPFGCDYSPIEPRPGAPEGDPVRVMKLPEMPLELKKTHSAPSWLAELQGRWFAGLVAEGLSSGDSPGDYALLYRSGTHMHHFVDALEREGIPYRVSSSRDFLRRQEVIDLRELMRCLLYPDDALAWVHTLRSYFFGIADEIITETLASGVRGYRTAAGCAPPQVARANAALSMLRQGLLTLDPGDFLMELFYRTRMMAVLCAGGYQVTRRLGNLQHILEQVLSGTVGSPMELLQLLDERLTPRRPEEPSRVPPEGGAVTISSIHSAKGLDWKTVVLASMPARTRSDRDAVISYDHGEKAAFDFRLSLDGMDRIRVRSPYWADIVSIEKARSLAEVRRLLYVAVTRARESLFVLAEPLESDSVSDAAILWDSVIAALQDDPGCCMVDELQPLDPLPAGPVEKARETLHDTSPEPEEPLLFGIEPVPGDWQPRGAALGDMVHQVMEKIDMSDPEGWLTGHGAFLGRLYGNDLEEVSRLCLTFFEMELPFDLRASTVLGREYPYFVRTPEGIRKRYIDLLL
ncbi:MAG: UvrD-helicase domain-containing protein, partial [Candidatus Fermentibacteraceae bacterium]|nr:UvrD-helicase domain-containing protein [Candidatus Fermentibacteraceae bacterium]